MQFDPEAFGIAMGKAIRDATQPLLDRIAALESKEHVPDAGKMVGLEAIVKSAVDAAVAALPPPAVGEKGERGDPGKDAPAVDVQQVVAGILAGSEIRSMIDSAVASHLSENPPAPGADGKDGMPGEKGEKGDPGKDGKDAEPAEVSQDEILAALKADPAFMREILAEHFKAFPPPAGERGEKGDKGDPGEKGERGESIKGEKGDCGADGVGLAGAMIDREGELIVTTTKGDAIKLGVVVGKNGERGADGANGLDGFGFDDLQFEYDGQRGLTLRFQRGERIKEFRIELPLVIDRGYWRDGDLSKAGDGVTHAGSYWIALRETKAKPCVENKEDWRLAVRKGRDGKDGRDGIDKVAPVKLVESAP